MVALFTNWSAFVSTSEESTGAYAARAAAGGLGIYLADNRGRILLSPTGGTDLGADVSDDPIYQQAQRSKVPGFTVVKKGGPLVPGKTVTGYAPMDQQLGQPALDWVAFAVEEEAAALSDANRLTRFLVLTTLLVGIIALVASVSLTVAPAGVIDLTRSLLATDLASRPERLMLPSTSTIELTAALRTSRPAASTSSERVWNSAIRAMAMTGTRESAT
ncbi:MAG: hypothetical protein ACKOTA_11515, partial [Solirubrobacterales bacterium]